MFEKLRVIMKTLGGTVFLFSFGFLGTCIGVRLLFTEDETKVKIAFVLILLASVSLYSVLFGSARPKRYGQLHGENESSNLALKKRKREVTEKERLLDKFYTDADSNSDIDSEEYNIDPNSELREQYKERQLKPSSTLNSVRKRATVDFDADDDEHSVNFDSFEKGMDAFQNMDDEDSLPKF